MEEEMIVAQRVVFDAIRVAGMDVTKVDISNKAVLGSLILYSRVLNNWRKRSSLQKRNVPERTIKRKATIASLQQQKKQKLAELKAEAAAIDSKIASVIESGKDCH